LILLSLFSLDVECCERRRPPASTKRNFYIGGDVQTPLTLTVADLRKCLAKLFGVTHIRRRKKITRVVLLEEILRKAGVPNDEHLRGAAMATYLSPRPPTATTFFSRLPNSIGNSRCDIIVADTLDGAPLPEKEGPFKIVALGKRPLVGPYARIIQRCPVAKQDDADPWHAVEEPKALTISLSRDSLSPNVGLQCLVFSHRFMAAHSAIAVFVLSPAPSFTWSSLSSQQLSQLSDEDKVRPHCAPPAVTPGLTIFLTTQKNELRSSESKQSKVRRHNHYPNARLSSQVLILWFLCIIVESSSLRRGARPLCPARPIGTFSPLSYSRSSC